MSRPLAVGLTSFGIVGLVLTSTASGLGGAASGAAPTEVVIQVTQDPTAGPAVRDVAQETAHIDPLLALSSGSIAAGGAVLVLRRMGARVRGVR